MTAENDAGAAGERWKPTWLKGQSIRRLSAATDECEALTEEVLAKLGEDDEEIGYGGDDEGPDHYAFEELEVNMERLASAICDEFGLPDSVIGGDLDEVIVAVASPSGRLDGALSRVVEQIAEMLEFLRSHSYGEKYTGEPPGGVDWDHLRRFFESFRGGRG